MWLPNLDQHPGPRYLALLKALETDIRTGKLTPGERLPPQRLLADLLGVHLSTITRAYKAAIERNLLTAETGNGTFVSFPNQANRLFALSQPAKITVDLSVSTSPQLANDDDLNQTLAALSQTRSLASCLAYRSWEAWFPLKQALAGWLGQHGVQDVSADAITLCAGAQHALTEVLSRMAKTGESVLCESLTYPGLKTVAAQFGIRLQGIPLTEDGIDLVALEKRLKQGGIRLLVLMPTLQNPTAVSMSLAARQQLVQLLSKYQITVIEEDVYGPLAAAAHTPLLALAPEHVIYISGLSKTVAPGLRLGMIVDPGQHLGLGEGHWHSTSWYVNPLLADVALRWLEDGTALRRLRDQGHELQARHQIVDELLKEKTCEPRCPHRWVALPSAKDSHILAGLLASHGILVAADSVFSTDGKTGPFGIRLALGTASDHAQLRYAIETLRDLKQRL